VHWAITGQTAAEIVHERVNAAKSNLGLTNWRGATIRKEDVAIAKNYLTEPEPAALNNLVDSKRSLLLALAPWMLTSIEPRSNCRS
jgi:hypothetical protein